MVEEGDGTDFPAGSRVMFTGPYGVLEDGAYSERLAVRKENLCLIPQGVDDVTAASIPVAYLTAQIAPGRGGLFELIKSMPPTLKHEPGMIVADGDIVIVHGRFSGFGAPVNWIAADILRIEDGILVEHWDVIQDEASQEQSKSGKPMFAESFPGC